MANHSEQLGFALVGCGRITRKHAEILAEGQVPGARLTTVCDPKEDRARHYGEKYDVPWYCDMHEMMREQGDSVDVISVLTESGNHARHAIELCQYGKHLVVEKPMALTIEDAEDMMDPREELVRRLLEYQKYKHASEALASRGLAGRDVFTRGSPAP